MFKRIWGLQNGEKYLQILLKNLLWVMGNRSSFFVSLAGERLFKCDVCGKHFSTNEYLKCHKRCHMGAKPYKCDVCGKTFGLRASLGQHSNVHAGKKCSLGMEERSEGTGVHRESQDGNSCQKWSPWCFLRVLLRLNFLGMIRTSHCRLLLKAI